jgi:hypothetical protein
MLALFILSVPCRGISTLVSLGIDNNESLFCVVSTWATIIESVLPMVSPGRESTPSRRTVIDLGELFKSVKFVGIPGNWNKYALAARKHPAKRTRTKKIEKKNFRLRFNLLLGFILKTPA